MTEVESSAGERAETVRADVVAGLTVALVGIPQCLAYAMMSGLPPAYGLVTAAVPGLVAALVGRSPHVVTGPTNTTGILILVAIAPYLGADGAPGADALRAVATLTLLAGVLRIVAALAGAEVVVRFMPESVLFGFTAGAGVLIAAMQLDEALGLPAVAGGGLWREVSGVLGELAAGARPAWPAAAVAAGVAAATWAGHRWLPRWPVTLAVVAAAAVAAKVLGLGAAKGLPLVLDRSGLPGGWPPIGLPSLSPGLVRDLVPSAAAIVLLGTLELVVTVRGGGGRPDMRREILAQGIANVGGAFAGAFPASASLTRSVLARVANGRTRLALGVAAVTAVPALLFGADLIGHVPLAALAGILIFTAGKMVSLRQLALYWRAAPEPRVLMVVTLLSTLFLPLEWAVFLGGGLGLLIHLARTSAPRLQLLRLEGERLVPVAVGEAPEAVVVEVSGDLHYAAVPSFLEDVEALLPPGARLVVVDLSHAHEMRLAALHALEALEGELSSRGARLRLCGVSDSFLALARRAGSSLQGTPARPGPGASARECLLAESPGG